MARRERQRAAVCRVDVVPQVEFLGHLSQCIEWVDCSGRGGAGDSDDAAGLLPRGAV
jgi:hypothetical protein